MTSAPPAVMVRPVTDVEPPPGIINVTLRCGHTAQMKHGIARIRADAGLPSWCLGCGELVQPA